MRVASCFISILIACSISAQDLFVTFEDVAAGTTDSAINIGTISKTNGTAVAFSWTGSAGKVSVENGGLNMSLLSPVTVGGNTYDGTATKHLLCKSDDTVSSHQKFTFTFAASRKISVGWACAISNFTGLGSFYNLGALESGGTYSVLSLINNNPPTMQAETNSDVGTSINVPNNCPLWVTCLWDSANRKTIWDFYNLTNGVLLGRSTGATALNATISTFTWGITDAHSKDAGTVYRMANAILYTNGTQWPVWPGGSLHFPTNLTPTGVTAAIAASSEGDTILLPATNATWTSGVTVSGNSRTIAAIQSQAGQGTNTTVITADGGFTAFTLSGSYNKLSNVQIKGDGTTDEADGVLVTGPHNRIEGCWLRELNVAIYWQDFGLCDGTVIDDCWKVGRVIFPSSYYATYYPLSPDSTNRVVYEDFVWNWTSAKNQTGSQNLISSQVAQALTLRHGTIVLNNASTDPAPVIDFHGDDQGSGIPVPGVDLEVYKVTMNVLAGSVSGQKWVDIRGSRARVYSNTVTGASYDASQGIYLREERPSDSPNYLVNNTYIWENYDGVSGTDAFPITDDANITAGVDYFTTALSPLVQLAYPHPWRSEAGAPSIPTIPATIGFGRGGVFILSP